MKTLKLLSTLFFLSFLGQGIGQTVSVVEPAGSQPPYEFLPGTDVTVQWDYFGEFPTMFTYTQEPDLLAYQFFPNGEWTQSSDVQDNGDGTYNYTITVTDDLWVWGGFGGFSGFAYSNVLAFSVASPIVIDFEDGLVCADGSGIETLSAAAEYDSYQWYKDDVLIDGATSMTYDAADAGAYKLQAPFEGDLIFSNTLIVTNPVIELTGDYIQEGTQLTASATEGFDSYQWFSGTDESNLTAIDGETTSSLVIDIQETNVFYQIQAVLDGCTVPSETRAVTSDAFTTPVIALTADTNSFGNVCSETPINMAVEPVYGTYLWYKNGFSTSNTGPSVSISQNWQTGDYSIEVSPLGWPEITLNSETVNVSYFEVDEPVLINPNPGNQCPGAEVNIILSDEGYDYTWYAHVNSNYTEDDLIDVEGTTHTFTFEDQIRITVEATFEGCTSSETVFIGSATDDSPFVSFVDSDDRYLCTDSISELQVPSWSAGDFQNFQWYQIVEDDSLLLEGATETIYGASTVGLYYVQAEILACPGEFVTSTPKEVESYLDRQVFIFADVTELCAGDTATLSVSAEWNWTDLQWFVESIQIGSEGYDEVFTPLIGGGSESTQEVDEFNSYIVKARHVSCPTGLKLESNIVSTKPLHNPNITVDPDYGVNLWRPAPWDSIPSYLYCTGEPVAMTLTDEYDTYAWYRKEYSGDSNYGLGELIEESTDSINTEALGARWFTAEVSVDGCVGYSDPVLIDTWTFSSPVIASYDNSELCGDGDSTLMHIAFPGNFQLIEWYRDGQLIEGSNNDTIYASIPGLYTVTIYREECPQFGISSGFGPVVSFFEPEIIEEEELIYASPAWTDYQYQWYLNGEPIDSPEETPWILYKDGLEDGIYTVEVTNIGDCTIETEEFVWNTLGLTELYEEQLTIYPNPAKDQIFISGVELELMDYITITDISGKEVLKVNAVSQVSLDQFTPGMYFVRITMNDGAAPVKKVMVQ